MTTPDPLDNGWDDWRRPSVWPLLLLAAAPPLGAAVIAFVVSRAIGA